MRFLIKNSEKSVNNTTKCFTLPRGKNFFHNLGLIEAFCCTFFDSHFLDRRVDWTMELV